MRLDVAATDAERAALTAMCRQLDALRLTLPGDVRRLRVRLLVA
ncbi:MAG: hypothetical protein ACHREM_11720 [Polyangiales bacterium]